MESMRPNAGGYVTCMPVEGRCYSPDHLFRRSFSKLLIISRVFLTLSLNIGTPIDCFLTNLSWDGISGRIHGIMLHNSLPSHPHLQPISLAAIIPPLLLTFPYYHSHRRLSTVLPPKMKQRMRVLLSPDTQMPIVKVRVRVRLRMCMPNASPPPP